MKFVCAIIVGEFAVERLLDAHWGDDNEVFFLTLLCFSFFQALILLDFIPKYDLLFAGFSGPVPVSEKSCGKAWL